MKVVASGSLLIGDGEVLEIMVGETPVRFGGAEVLPPQTNGEVNITVPANCPNQLVAAPSLTLQIGGTPVRHRLGFAKVLGSGTLVHYTFFKD